MAMDKAREQHPQAGSSILAINQSNDNSSVYIQRALFPPAHRVYKLPIMKPIVSAFNAWSWFANPPRLDHDAS